MAHLRKFKELAMLSDNFTDEMMLEGQFMSYGNEAIAIINTEAGLILPFVTDMNQDYLALPINWFVRLINVWMSYGIKMNDGSLNEAQMYYERFWQALEEFKEVAHEVVDEEYIDQDVIDKTISRIDVNPNIKGWF